jgi:LmbE family N-acetylglucosaminyl deacetylase
MIRLNFEAVRSVLCLGAHADDIEIGCGGTVLRLLRDRPGLDFVWVVFSAEGSRSREAKSSARVFLKGAGKARILIKHFRNGFFPFRGEEIKEFFEKLKETVQPDLIFTHYREDRHQDHRVLSDLAWNTFRDHVILEYEVPKYDGDIGNPNFYVELDEELCHRKIEQACRYFQTQGSKHWFSSDTFLSLMRLRGVECASRTKYSEAFYCRKLAF